MTPDSVPDSDRVARAWTTGLRTGLRPDFDATGVSPVEEGVCNTPPRTPSGSALSGNRSSVTRPPSAIAGAREALSMHGADLMSATEAPFHVQIGPRPGGWHPNRHLRHPETVPSEVTR